MSIGRLDTIKGRLEVTGSPHLLSLHISVSENLFEGPRSGNTAPTRYWEEGVSPRRSATADRNDGVEIPVSDLIVPSVPITFGGRSAWFGTTTTRSTARGGCRDYWTRKSRGCARYRGAVDAENESARRPVVNCRVPVGLLYYAGRRCGGRMSYAKVVGENTWRRANNSSLDPIDNEPDRAWVR